MPMDHVHSSGSTLSIRTTLRTTFVLAMLACMAVVGMILWRLTTDVMEDRLRLTRNAVMQAIEIARRHHGQIGPSHTEQQAKAEAIQEIMKLRYDGNEYVWVNDMHPTMVAHPFKPDLNGKDLTTFKDPKGKALFVEFVTTVKTSGRGYVDYLWPKPNQTEPVPKRSYVQGFEPWGWVLGSGVYIDEVRTAVAREAIIAAAGVLTVLVVGGFFIERVIRRITKRLDAARELLLAMSNGDLSRSIDPGRPDEVGLLLQQALATQGQLTTLVGRIRSAADSIASASSQIASGNQDLSQRTETTASNLQHAAGSTQLLADTVRHSADSAAQATQLASAAAELAQQGGASVGAVVTTMTSIHDSATRINNIIGVIDGIAFQTNILALNAAVEAARAGEQGRGFAVVAGEVRSLAGRSADAAREIKTLIGTSVERAEAGSAQVAEAGRTMNELVAAVRRVADVIGEVKSASAEQSGGIQTVSRSVQDLDQMTQQNAALVEQSAAAAESLRRQSEDLAQAVASFRLQRA